MSKKDIVAILPLVGISALNQLSVKMTIAVAVVFVAVVAAVAGICEDATLGLDHWHCQPCGSPGLDSFCVKRAGRCSGVVPEVRSHSNVAPLPPNGYTNPATVLPILPASCVAIKKAIELKKELGTPPIYKQTPVGRNDMPRVYFNPDVTAALTVKRPLHDCLENNLPMYNGRWNWADPRATYYTAERLDSFYFTTADLTESTWSYQCYCDFCQSCQTCTSG